MEIWKPIKNFETYEVSSYGKVRNAVTGKVLAQRLHEYLFVNLYKKGKIHTKTVHRLVAKAFIPNPNNLPCVNHRDENNNVSNLEWCTYKQNCNYGTRNLRISQKNRGKKYNFPSDRRIKVLAISKSGQKYHFDSIDQCAKELGLYRSNANRALHGYQKTTGGYEIRRDCEA